MTLSLPYKIASVAGLLVAIFLVAVLPPLLVLVWNPTIHVGSTSEYK